jgi:hypothetical protein
MLEMLREASSGLVDKRSGGSIVGDLRIYENLERPLAKMED